MPHEVFSSLVNTVRRIAESLRLFILLFIVILLFSQRGVLKEIFNYKVIYGEAVYAFKARFLKDTATSLLVPGVNLVPAPTDAAPTQIRTPAESAESKIILVIPKISVTAPLLWGETASEQHLLQLLKQGVVAYPASAPIGQEGTTVILGHSAPPGWPKIRYDWVFTNLNKLNAGDLIQISEGGKEYVYEVTKKFFLQKGQEIPLVSINGSKSIIVLLTCWPPGIDQKRLAVQAELK